MESRCCRCSDLWQAASVGFDPGRAILTHVVWAELNERGVDHRCVGIAFCQGQEACSELRVHPVKPGNASTDVFWYWLAIDSRGQPRRNQQGRNPANRGVRIEFEFKRQLFPQEATTLCVTTGLPGSGGVVWAETRDRRFRRFHRK